MRCALTGLAAALIVGFAAPALAGDPGCTCRARNVTAYLGDTVCIVTPNGPKLARCDKVLNNTSWTFLDKACPQASLDRFLGIDVAAHAAPQSTSIVLR